MTNDVVTSTGADGALDVVAECRGVNLAATGSGKRAIQILNDVTFSVAAGEFVCILGPSGCGKSTILNAISGLQLPGPLTGDILLKGAPRQAYDSDVAYMVQHDTLLPWRTTRQNVQLAANLRNVDVEVDRLLDSVGLREFASFFPAQLSGGMRKRAQLARVLAQHPKLLLMDEPFGALDFQTRNDIYDVFLERWLEFRCGVAFVTHDLTEAITLADRILVMSKRPATVVKEFVVDLPRPRRQRELIKRDDYRELHEALWAALSGSGAEPH
jgi:NitT/TauT family transport system ATP-binding protein